MNKKSNLYSNFFTVRVRRYDGEASVNINVKTKLTSGDCDQQQTRVLLTSILTPGLCRTPERRRFLKSVWCQNLPCCHDADRKPELNMFQTASSDGSDSPISKQQP